MADARKDSRPLKFRPQATGRPPAAGRAGAFSPESPSAIRSRVLDNIAASERARGASRFDVFADIEKHYRLKVSEGRSGGRAFCVAEYEINGARGSMKAQSGASRPGDAPRVSDPEFGTYDDGWPRINDAENKVLDALAKSGFPENATGTVKLYIDRPVCESCLHVVDQFEVMWPQIKVQIRAPDK